jgi:hypothetical protein
MILSDVLTCTVPCLCSFPTLPPGVARRWICAELRSNKHLAEASPKRPSDRGAQVIVAVMRKARLTKKRSADDLGVDELTDDLGVEIDTRPASQRGSSRQSWPPSDEEDEAMDVDDDNDRDFAPGRRASSRATKKPKRPAGRRKPTADESSDEEAEESEEEEEEEEEESAGAESSAEDDAGGGGEQVEEVRHEVARRGSGGGGGGGGGGGAASSSSGVVGVRAAKPKKVVSSATLLDATSHSYEVDKILTWRWAQPELESTAAAGPGAEAAGAVVVDALKAFSQVAESGVDTGHAVGMEVELHGGARQFYIKWAGRSYHHSAWVEEEELKGMAAVKLRYFLKVREMSAAGAVTAEEARCMAKGGDRLEEIVQPDWLKAERVLDRCAWWGGSK